MQIEVVVPNRRSDLRSTIDSKVQSGINAKIPIFLSGILTLKFLQSLVTARREPQQALSSVNPDRNEVESREASCSSSSNAGS